MVLLHWREQIFLKNIIKILWIAQKYFSNKVNDKCIYDQKMVNKLFFFNKEGCFVCRYGQQSISIMIKYLELNIRKSKKVMLTLFLWKIQVNTTIKIRNKRLIQRSKMSERYICLLYVNIWIISMRWDKQKFSISWSSSNIKCQWRMWWSLEIRKKLIAGQVPTYQS